MPISGEFYLAGMALSFPAPEGRRERILNHRQ